MALTNAERQRRHYERQKAKKKEAMKQAADVKFSDFASEPFFEVFQRKAGQFSEFFGFFDTAGLEAPEIPDDSDPRSNTGQIELGYQPEESPYSNGGGSLARAEIMVGCLIEAAAELARIINDYKRHEITSHLHALESADFTDTRLRTKAIADIVKFQQMLGQLDKEVRWTFPQWKASVE